VNDNEDRIVSFIFDFKIKQILWMDIELLAYFEYCFQGDIFLTILDTLKKFVLYGVFSFSHIFLGKISFFTVGLDSIPNDF
jgi:hypothetical protein